MTPQQRQSLAAIAAWTLAAAALLLVFLYAYWKATVPGYFESLDLCAKGCHTTRVLAPREITHPWWCVGCHGFGVKSDILPGIPLHRDHELELQVERHGECLMCHSVSDKLHLEHMKTSEKEETKEVVKCVDCHTDAYHGGHTDLPGNKVCIRCHDAEKTHTSIVNKRLIANCLACHGPSPLAAAEELKKGATTYGIVASIGSALSLQIGPRTAAGCEACHNTPDTAGHLKHVGKEVKLAPGIERPVACTDCHLSYTLHGTEVPVTACTRCHHSGDTRFHDKGWLGLLSSCNRCHGGFRSNATKLLPSEGCRACHHDTYIEAAAVGLHAPHLALYGYNCSVCHSPKAKTHREFIESVSRDPNRLCKRCHTDTGGLTKDAFQGLARPLAVSPDARHAKLAERARGDCLSCHSEWKIAAKPRVFYYYNATSTRLPRVAEGTS